MGCHKLASPCPVSPLAQAPGKFGGNTQSPNCRALDNGNVSSLVEYLHDLLRRCTSALTDAGLYPQNVGKLKVSSIGATEIECGLYSLPCLVKAAAISQSLGI